MKLPRLVLAAVVLPALALAPMAAAQASLDPLLLSLVATGHGKVRLTVAAGPSGAPAGFTVTWMSRDRFQSLGRTWPASAVAGQGSATFTGVATLNTWGAGERSFQLGAGEALDVEIGDLFDESGVAGTVAPELPDGQEYVFAAWANGAAGGANGPLSNTVEAVTTMQGVNCTFTIGYWKTHPESWPVAGLTIGTVTYTKSQLLQVLGTPVKGNGLVSLAHQLIAARLNLAMGTDGAAIAGALPAADAVIGGLVVPSIGTGALPTSETGPLVQSLDDYNNGVIGPGHCPSVGTLPATWGSLKNLYR